MCEDMNRVEYLITKLIENERRRLLLQINMCVFRLAVAIAEAEHGMSKGEPPVDIEPLRVAHFNLLQARKEIIGQS